MPGRDGTGPMGTGPMTGRGAGFCTGNTVMYYNGFFGCGCGFGGGRGLRTNFYAAGLRGAGRFANPAVNGVYQSKAEEKELLIRYAKDLENQLSDIKKRITDFKDGEE